MRLAKLQTGTKIFGAFAVVSLSIVLIAGRIFFMSLSFSSGES